MSWRESSLGAEIELAYGKSLQESARQGGSVPVYGSNGIVGWHDKALLDGPGIIIGRKGSVGAINYSEKAFWPIDTTYYVVNKGGHDWRFLHFLLLTLRLDGMNGHAVVPGLNRETAYAVPVTLPLVEEQRKIAAILGKVQAAVEVEVELIRVTRELKRSALHQLFTRGLRGEAQKETDMGPLPESWNVVLLSSQREFLQYGTSAKCSTAGRGIPVLRIPNIVGGAIDTTDLKYAELPDAEMEKLRLEKGDVLFVRTNGQRRLIGRCAVYKGDPISSAFASYLIRARFKPDTVDPDYFQYYTETETGRSFLAGQANGAADGKFNLNTQAINAALIPLPKDRIEQREIAAHLATIDAKLAHHEARQKLLRELFRTLLRDLMTARRRVTGLDLTALTP